MSKQFRAAARHIKQAILKSSSWALTMIGNSKESDGDECDNEDENGEEENDDFEKDEVVSEPEVEAELEKAEVEEVKKKQTMKRPAAAEPLQAVYMYGFDREHKLAWRRLAGKKDAKNEWAIEIVQSDADGAGTKYPIAVFVDGTKFTVQTLTWPEYTELINSPVSGRLWEDKIKGVYIVKKPDRTPLLICYQTTLAPKRDVQICQVQLKHFGDPNETAFMGRQSGHHRTNLLKFPRSAPTAAQCREGREGGGRATLTDVFSTKRFCGAVLPGIRCVCGCRAR
jgi:hypothetical protein